jgi:hypothetical protein
MHNTLFATLRYKRRPISNAVICLKLRVSYALPVHKYALEELDVSDYATQQDINTVLANLQMQYKCSDVELDIKKDVAGLLERNGS